MLQKSLTLLAVVASLFAVFYVVAAVALGGEGLAGVGVVVAAFAVFVGLAARLAALGRSDDARMLTAGALCVVCGSVALLQPRFAVALALATTIGLAVALPIQDIRRVYAVVGMALVAELLIVRAASIGTPPAGLSQAVFAGIVTAQILVSFGFVAGLALQARRHLDAQGVIAREHAAKLDAVLAAISDIVLAIDEDDRVLTVNRRATEALGEDLVGRPLSEVLPIREVDGVTRLGDAPVEVISRSAGDALRVVVIRDRTIDRALDEVRAEQEALRAAEKLSRVHLLSVQRALRVPIRTISGLARSLAAGHEGPLGPRTQGVAADLARSAEGLENLSSTWLELARVGTGQTSVVPRATDLREALDAVLERGAAPQRGVRVHGDIQDACIAVDPRRLRQVTYQLLDYARRRSPDQQDIRVVARVADEALRISVRFAGTMTAEHLDGVFRVDPGMALARSLVELLGGEIGVADRGLIHIEFSLPLVARSAGVERAELDRSEILARMVEHLSEVVEITDQQGHFQYVNPAFEATFGWSADEVLGRTPAEMVRSRVHSDAFWKEIWDTISSGQVWRGRIVSRARGGDLLHFDAMISPIRDGTGQITHYVAIKRNASQHLELEGQLRQVQRVAAGVAHQINNPLTIVLANLSFLGEVRSFDAEERRLLDEIDESCHRIRRVVGDLRRFSSAHGEEALVDVRVLLDFAVEMARPVAAGRVRIVREYGDIPMILGDRSQLVQVFQHLVSNALQAIEAADSGLGSVIVRCGPDDDGNLVVEVHDSGDGVRAEDRDRIFQPFFTRRRGAVHRGMGLPISMGFVRRHGGDIRCLDTEVGTTFRVLLPAWKPEPEPLLGFGADPRSLRILAIDDEPELLKVLVAALSDHEVRCASGADDAAALLQEERFDLVLCDLVMPGRSGMELYRDIVELDPELAARFTFMTGADLVPEVERFLDGIDSSLLMKPFSLGELRRFVRAWAASRVSSHGT